MAGRRDVMARFWEKVEKRGDGCWQWLAGTQYGYGRFHWDGRTVRAHRFAYEWFVGPIPEGLHLDHLCRNRACVNPDHLEPVTCAVNVLRGVAPTAENARKTVCASGHPLKGENVYYRPAPDGVLWRRCRQCGREAVRRYQRKRRAEREEAA